MIELVKFILYNELLSKVIHLKVTTRINGYTPYICF